jgi:hypothetical protein
MFTPKEENKINYLNVTGKGFSIMLLGYVYKRFLTFLSLELNFSTVLRKYTESRAPDFHILFLNLYYLYTIFQTENMCSVNLPYQINTQLTSWQSRNCPMLNSKSGFQLRTLFIFLSYKLLFCMGTEVLIAEKMKIAVSWIMTPWFRRNLLPSSPRLKMEQKLIWNVRNNLLDYTAVYPGNMEAAHSPETSVNMY